MEDACLAAAPPHAALRGSTHLSSGGSSGHASRRRTQRSSATARDCRPPRKALGTPSPPARRTRPPSVLPGAGTMAAGRVRRWPTVNRWVPACMQCRSTQQALTTAALQQHTLPVHAAEASSSRQGAAGEQSQPVGGPPPPACSDLAARSCLVAACLGSCRPSASTTAWAVSQREPAAGQVGRPWVVPGNRLEAQAGDGRGASSNHDSSCAKQQKVRIATHTRPVVTTSPC